MRGLFSLEILQAVAVKGLSMIGLAPSEPPPPKKFLCGQYTVQIPQKYIGKDCNINQGPHVVTHAKKLTQGTLKIA